MTFVDPQTLPIVKHVCPVCGKAADIIYTYKHEHYIGCDNCVETLWYDDEYFDDVSLLEECELCHSELPDKFYINTQRTMTYEGCEHCVEIITTNQVGLYSDLQTVEIDD